MKRRFYITFLLLLTQIFIYSQSFSPGNIVVVRVGNGVVSPDGSTAPVFLDEYNPSGGFVRSIPLPTVVNGINRRLTFAGTNQFAGILSLSPDQRWLSLAGLDTSTGIALGGSTGATVKRVIALVGYDGIVNTSTALTGISGVTSVPSSAVTSNGSAIWACIGNAAFRYSTLGASSSTQVVSTTGNRVVGIYGGNLYTGANSGQIYKVGNSLPTIGPQTLTTLITGPAAGDGQSAFFMADLSSTIPGYDVIYISNSAGATGGIRKFSFDGSTWTLNGKIGVSAEMYGNIAGVINGTTVTLYVTRKLDLINGGSELVTLTDNTGHTITANSFVGNPVILTTATSNTVFRGVAMAPIKCKQAVIRVGAASPTGVQVFVTDSSDAGGPYEYAITPGSTPPNNGIVANSNIVYDNTLTPGTHYYMHVRRNCGGGDFSSWSTIDFTTGWPPCTAPTNFVQNLSGSSVGLSWDNVFTSIKYEYAVSTNPTPAASGLFTINPTINLSGLLSAKQYYLHLRTYCGGGDTSAWSTKSFTTPCFAPTPYLITNNWQAGTAEIGWNGESRDQVFEYSILNNEAIPGSSMRFVYDTIIGVKDLIPGNRYHLSVRQRCAGGTVSDWGKLEFNVSGAHVYPSPANDQITIRIYGQETNGKMVYIYDVNGRQMIALKLAGNTATTNIERWSRGVYFVRFGNEHKYLRRFIKQ